MASTPPQVFEDSALQNIQYAHYSDQHYPTAYSDQSELRGWAATPPQTIHRASHPPTLLQASSPYDSLHPQYPSNTFPSTLYPFNPQDNLYYANLSPAAPHYTGNAQDYQSLLHGSYTDFSGMPDTTSRTLSYSEFPSSHFHTSDWLIPEHDYPSLQPDHEAFSIIRPTFQQQGSLSLHNALNAHTPRPTLIQNGSMMVPLLNAQPQSVSAMPPQWLHAEASYLPRELPDTMNAHGHSGLPTEYAVTGMFKDNTQLPGAPDEGTTTCGPANQLSQSPVSKRRRGDRGPRNAKRLRTNQRDIGSLTHDESDGRGRDTSTKESYAQQHHELVPSRERSSAYNRSTRRSVFDSGARSEPRNGFFAHSSNNVIHQPIMVDISQQHHHAQGDQPDGTLLWLEDYIMKGAEFDSSERDPPPRCHPNTRASLIERMLGWIKDPRREKKMRWVRGTAGVGKSAIVQTVFESLPEDIRGGSVFFSRPNGRNNPNEVFPSFAYQLAVRDLSYRAYLKELMLKDPRSLCKSMKEQFRILFKVPFAEQKLLEGHGALVIALDGLDECGGDRTDSTTDATHSRGRSSELAQRTIVELISDFIQKYPSVPLIWIIASRPEKHLQVAFSSAEVMSTFSEEEVPVDSEEACQDVEKYLNSEFTRIRQDHKDLIPSIPWPSSKDFSLITTKALGLFIFAEVLIRFVDESNPVAQLKYALAAISKASAAEVAENPLVFLDVMYMEIVSRVPSMLLEPATKIVGAFVLLEQRGVGKRDATFPTICNILDIPKDVALTSLRHLHSILFVPTAITFTRPKFYHTSFRDFLEDESRSREYSINEAKISDDLAEGLMRLYRKESLDEALFPWPQYVSSYHNKENSVSNFGDIASLLHFHATMFPSKFDLSEMSPFPLWLIRWLVIGMSPGLFKRIYSDRVSAILNTVWNLPNQEKNEKCGIVCRKPIDSFGITRDSVSKCNITSVRAGYYTVYLNETRYVGDSEDIVALREFICSCIEQDSQRLVTVWGCEEFKRLALLEFEFDDRFPDPPLAKHPRRFLQKPSLSLTWAVAVIGF